MVKHKKSRILITIQCNNCYQNKNKRTNGISRYFLSKNRRNTPKKLELMKYCRYCNQHFLHVEIK